MIGSRRPFGVALGVALIVVLLAGCGGGNQQPSSPATVAGTSAVAPSAGGSTATAAVCADADALRASMDRLRTAATEGQNGLSVVAGELTTMRVQLQRLVTDAQGAYGPQVRAVKAQVSALGSTLRTAGASPTPGTSTEVAAGFRQLGVAVDDLVHSVTQAC